MAQKRYKCEVFIQTYKYVIVRAKNAREAKAKAHKRVSKMHIGLGPIDKQYTDPEEER
jgi:hypothetical protein